MDRPAALLSDAYDHDMIKFARRTFAAPLVDAPSENWQISDAQLQTHLAHLCQHRLFPEGATCHHVPRHIATPCGKEVDPDGQHAWQCNRGGVIARHNLLAKAWRDLCIQAGWDAHVEQEVLLPTPDMQVKRADVLVIKPDATQVILDVRTLALTNPPERAIAAAVRQKQGQYHCNPQNQIGAADFKPLIHCIQGPWGWDAVKLGMELQRPIAERLQHSLGTSWGSCCYRARQVIRQTITGVELATRQRVLDAVRGVQCGHRWLWMTSQAERPAPSS